MTPALAALCALTAWAGAETPPPWPGDAWRQRLRIVDVHQHIEASEERLQRAVSILDKAGIGLALNLSGGVVTSDAGKTSEFEHIKELSDRVAPGRFLLSFNLDYSHWDDPDFSQQAVRQAEKAAKLGAAGFKEFKRLGLYLRDRAGRLIRVDDPKLDAFWRRCGELGLPVSIHVADPRAFWLPYNATNERWKELRDHPAWWFGDPARYPSREALLAALERVVSRHPETQFISVHFGNNAEEIDWVARELAAYPNLSVDLAARIPELGRHDPEAVRRLFVQWQDRILFATDFQVYDKLILGSSGDDDKPADKDALQFFKKEWRWLETQDRDWPHMTPIQGDWNISSIHLPSDVLRKVYFDNARRLFARSIPAATLRAARIGRDFRPDGRLDRPEWSQAEVFPMEQETRDGSARPELTTACRALWSAHFLYVAYECPFTSVTDYGATQAAERITSPNALWDRDVVELFVAPDPARLNQYSEYEWAPNNDALDLLLDRPKSDFAWSSGMVWKVRVDRRRAVWICEARIPWSAFGAKPPRAGARWRANLYRIDRAHHAFLASNPTLTPSFHTPERFGWLEFSPETARP